jgi:isochorismate synthase
MVEKQAISIQDAIGICLEKNAIFAAYRLPDAASPEIVVQKDREQCFINKDVDFSKLNGFFVAPFSEADCCPPFVIRPDIYASGIVSQMQAEEMAAFDSHPIQSKPSHMPCEISHEDYLKQINFIVSEICSGKFEKVVPSRVKVVNGKYIDHLPKIFEKLCSSYPNAFVYIFNAGAHLWIGATPELLLKARNGSMHTVSLAGTRSFSETNLNLGAWNSKERLEQEYVTRYISKVLSKFNLKNVELEGPYVKKAGNLVHLRTDFSFNSAELQDKLGDFLYNLHPTPAVCGMPRKESLQLISELELHHREYYSGFLGPAGLKNRLSFFVNLRCMKVLEDKLALFIGGGITADSVPEEEWLETEIKAETLLSVIRQLKL